MNSQNSKEKKRDQVGEIRFPAEGIWTLVKSYQSLLDEQTEEDGIPHLP